jgi:Ala-tRNA(Pro) deacylase
MAINQKLQELLDRERVGYEVVPHRETVRMHDAAQATHVSGRHVAKPVVVRDSAGIDFMVVLPSSWQLARHVLERVTGRTSITIEDESELRRLFPDCEVGAMPPFGHLYGLTMYVDPCLIEDQDDIWFQAGNHHELVRMSVEDFARTARPFFRDACLHHAMAETA